MTNKSTIGAFALSAFTWLLTKPFTLKKIKQALKK